MSDYVDDAAERSDGSDGENEHEPPQKFADSSEEDEDEQNEYEDDGFINDEIVEEDDDDEPPVTRLHGRDDDDEDLQLRKKKKKKKRRHHEDPDLAEEDLELLNDNGIRVNRKKRLKRLKKGASDEEPDDDIAEDVRNLSRDEEDENIDERRRRADELIDYEDDLDDFIDDGGRSRRRRAAERDGLVSSEAVRTARSIFGDIDEIAHVKSMSQPLRKEGLRTGHEDDDDGDEDYIGDSDRPRRGPRDDLSDEDEDEEAPARRGRQQDAEGGAIAKGLAAPVDDKEAIKRIVKKDIPERLQEHFGPRYEKPSDPAIRDEANWIFRKGFLDNPLFNGDPAYQEVQVVQKIIVFLSYLHIDNLDVPFIAMYRKDYISPLLISQAGEYVRHFPTAEQQDNTVAMTVPRGFNSVAYEDFSPGLSFEHERGVPRGYDDGFGDWFILWYIFDFDKKYADMIRRRNGLLDAVEEAHQKGVHSTILDDVRTMAHACDDEKELKDGERHLRLAMELADALNKNRMDDFDDDINDKRSKRPSRRRNRYADFCKRGYRPLTKELGIDSRQFGENLKGVCDYGAGSQVHIPMESDSDPIDTAKLVAIRTGDATGEHSNVGDKLARRVLDAARFIMVTEVASDIAVLQATRRILRRPGTVTITTEPTPQGIAQVDDTHPLRCVTCLKEKRIESFYNTADYALIRRAEELGYTRMKIVFRPDQIDIFRKHLLSSILIDTSSSHVVDKWNEERRKVVEDVHGILLKTMRDEVREELEEMTSFVLRYKLTNAASRRLLLGPCRPIKGENGCPRVLAFCVTSEDDEEEDPLQRAKDADEAIDRKEGLERRVASERLTVVDTDENGEYRNGYELFASWLRRPMRRDGVLTQLPSKVKEQLKTFLLRSKALVVVIGIGSGQRTPVRLRSDLIEVVKEMVISKSEGQDEPWRPAFLTDEDVAGILKAYSSKDDGGDAMKKMDDHLSRHFVLCDDYPCRVYAGTKWSMAGLSVDAMTLLEKRAIGLARMAQEPLWVYCAIGQEREAAARLQLHPYHFYANPADRVLAFQRALIRTVCSTGVDINRSLRLPHTQSLVPFVGGLGIHKGNALLKELGNVLSEDDRGLTSRKHLWSENFMGKVVFLSSAAFLRVRDPEIHYGGSTARAEELRRRRLNRSRGRRRDDDDDKDVFDPMDDSRIHPEHYAVAIKIADEALRDDRGHLRVHIPQGEERSSVLMTSAVLDDPYGLQGLALDEYAHHLENLGRGTLFETVKMIASEFRGTFRDFRQQLHTPPPMALFYVVTGADPMLVRVGSAVTATNCQIRNARRRDDGGAPNIAGIVCSLPHNIRGFIPAARFSDDELDDGQVRRLVADGSSIPCRIMEFQYEKFEVQLSSKLSVLANPALVEGYTRVVDENDHAYRPYPKLMENGVGHVGEGPSRELLRKQTTQRETFQKWQMKISHPLFKNLSGVQTISLLQSALPGEIIIRPSPYNDEEIVFSCKFATFIKLPENRSVLHISCSVLEGKREPSGASINGTGEAQYMIGDTTYEHIEQVLEEYVRPIISNLSEAIDNRKFVEGTVDELKKHVEKQKQQNQMSIPYCFGLSSHNRRGRLVMVFIPGTKTVVTEEIDVIPNGYRFRKTLHIHIEKLIAWFKMNMRKGASALGSSAASTAAQGGGRDASSALYRSPFRTAAASPFQAPASPYHGAAGYLPNAPPRHPPPQISTRPGVRPVSDATPPMAPSAPPVPSGAAVPAQGGQNVSGAYGFSEGGAGGGAPGGVAASYGGGGDRMDWSKATRQLDEPPPPAVNGAAGGGGGPDRRHVGGRRMEGPVSGYDNHPGGRGSGIGRGIIPDRNDGDRMDRRANMNMIGGQQRPSWRGQAPIPAWKKQQMEAEQSQQ